jgi:hypothetical protein
MGSPENAAAAAAAAEAAAMATAAEKEKGGVEGFEKKFKGDMLDTKDKFDDIFGKAHEGMKTESDFDARYDIYANALAEMRSHSVEFSKKMVVERKDMADSDKFDALQIIKELSSDVKDYINKLDNVLLESC